jgi:hypothetical protein
LAGSKKLGLEKMNEVMTSATLVGHILGMLDEDWAAEMMRMRRHPDGRVRWPTIRGINWAWRVAFDLCAPKAIGLDTYWLYNSPLQAPIARGSRGNSSSCMHAVRRIELRSDEAEYADFLEFCSPCQFATVTQVSPI